MAAARSPSRPARYPGRPAAAPTGHGEQDRFREITKPLIKIFSAETELPWEFPVLYEDEHLLALDKPPGLAVSADPSAPEIPALLNLLREGIAQRKTWAIERRLGYLVNAHRLEPGASGVLLLARSKPALVSLQNHFGGDKPLLRFLALIQGKPAGSPFAVNTPLGPDARRPGLLRVDPKGGKRARTQFSVIEQFESFALLHCEPVPPRPHQISAHLRSAGLPVVGDQNYGGKPLLLSRLKAGYRLKPGRVERPLLSRPAVHAELLTVPHPVTGQVLSIQAPLPKDLSVALKYLSRFSSTTVEPEGAEERALNPEN